MNKCKSNCGRLEVQDDQVICMDCGRNFGHLVDIVDHAVLRCETMTKLEKAEALLKDAWDAGWENSWRHDMRGSRSYLTFEEWKSQAGGEG